MGSFSSRGTRQVEVRRIGRTSRSAHTLGIAAVLVVLGGVGAPAQVATPGTSLGLTVGLGSQGSFSYVETGVVLPKIGGSFSIEVKARAMSSMTWVGILEPDLAPPMFHPVAVGGIVTFGGCSPMFQGFFRVYGATDVFLGYTFTPYDSGFYGVPNLVGPNLTYSLFGYLGLELFTGARSSIFIDSGGGFKNLLVSTERKTDPYVVAASWLGSGFGVRMGTKLYLH